MDAKKHYHQMYGFKQTIQQMKMTITQPNSYTGSSLLQSQTYTGSSSLQLQPLGCDYYLSETNNGKSIDYGSTAGGLSLAIQRFNLSGYAKEPYQRSCQILQEYMNYTESSDNPYRIISNWLSTINYIFTSSVYPLNEIFRDRLQHQN